MNSSKATVDVRRRYVAELPLSNLALTLASKIMVAVETHELADVGDQNAKLRMEWQNHSTTSDVKGEIVAV